MRQTRLINAIVYLCGLFLFLEWLYPIQTVSETESMSIFVIFAVYCFLIASLQLSWGLGILLKGFGMIFILDGLYFDLPVFSADWFDALYLEVIKNTEMLFNQKWYYLSSLFRSFLFLLLIWLMSDLLYYWFVQMKRIFMFVVMTFIYVALLDTFTLYNGALAIIRIFIISFIGLALVNHGRHLKREKLSFHWAKEAPYLLTPVFILLSVSLLIGVISPKLESQWPDPVPYIYSAAETVTGTGGETVQKVGYGEDDTALGGSFIQDHTTVFYAEVSEAHYWRIETKDVYTGKGWETSAEPDFMPQDAAQIELETFNNHVQTIARTARVEFAEGETIPKLVYPYGLERSEMDFLEEEYYLDPVTEAIEVRENGRKIEPVEYELTYDQPLFNIEDLQKSTDYPENMDRFLQLPDTLPDRVADLAEEITEPFDSRYDKVRAVEHHFNSTDFAYETTGVAVPGPGEDYVDQFLFETKIGYCDNFSTAMVVMLRTLDIPARWVKGFTSGDLIEAGNGTGLDKYEITNANAHSWVEVYFPEAGWVPFEPTKGFANPAEFHLSSGALEAMEEELLEVPEPQTPEEEEENLPEEESEEAFAAADGKNAPENGLFVMLALGILSLFIYILYKQREKLRTKMYEVKLRRRKNVKDFGEAYLHLLSMLNRNGLGREPDQTLREYAKQVDARYETHDMGILTDYYERILYRNEFNEAEWKVHAERWKKLMNRIAG